MGFVIEKIGNRKPSLPEGHYIVLDGIEYQIYEVTISASGNVCLKIWDPIRKEHGVKTLCTIEELVLSTIPSAIYKEY